MKAYIIPLLSWLWPPRTASSGQSSSWQYIYVGLPQPLADSVHLGYSFQELSNMVCCASNHRRRHERERYMALMSERFSGHAPSQSRVCPPLGAYMHEALGRDCACPRKQGSGALNQGR